jgi:hypothetical protein
VSAAQLSGQPIVPVSYHLPWKIRMGSWDGFQIPFPFSPCNVRVAELVRVPRDADDAEREALRKLLEDRLKSISRD